MLFFDESYLESPPSLAFNSKFTQTHTNPSDFGEKCYMYANGQNLSVCANT